MPPSHSAAPPRGGGFCAASPLLLLAAAAAAALPHAAALSWPLCEQGGATWVTERPATESTTPGSDLMFFCQAGLNILGDPISPCTHNGSLCWPAQPAIADAVCRLMGFDRVWMAEAVVSPAPPSQPVKALTGEWCVRNGSYSAARPRDISALQGEPCPQFERIACIKTRESLIQDVQDLNSALDAAALAAPAAEAARTVMTSAAEGPPASTRIVLVPVARQADGARGAEAAVLVNVPRAGAPAGEAAAGPAAELGAASDGAGRRLLRRRA